MKKFALTLLIMILSLTVAFSTAACNLFGSGTTDDKGGKDTTKEDKEKEKKEKQKLLDDYQAIITEILAAINNADTPEEYIAALLAVLEKIPRETITDAVGIFAGSDVVATVNEYYNQAITVIGYVKTLLPYTDKILSILQSDLGKLAAAILFGITYDSLTDTYSKDGYSFRTEKDEDGNDIYWVTDKNGNKYYLAFDMENKALEGKAGKTINEGYDYLIETKIDGNNIYFQLLDLKKDKLFQAKINAETLEAVVSIDSGKTEFDYSIAESIPANFATSGLIFNINKDMIADLIDIVNS